jgi:hypothetical protein
MCDIEMALEEMRCEVVMSIKVLGLQSKKELSKKFRTS